MTETIFARASGAGRAAVAIIRISGPETGVLVRSLSGSLPAPRVASVRTLRDGCQRLLDEALVLWMPGPASFTGDDCAELHVHGGPAVVDGVSDALILAGARPAHPGEFSRRAFENGKLDLLQAEAVADLVDAETETQRRQALNQLQGAASRKYQEWRRQIMGALAFVEAELDFPDEDLPGAIALQAEQPLRLLLTDLEGELATATRGLNIRDGYRVALIGKVNAGKSSLFNCLLERDAAIVSAKAGTTRDVVEARLDVGAFRVMLADTAGVRVVEDEVEAEGVRRAQVSAESAALRLFVHDGSSAEPLDTVTLAWTQPGDLLVITKDDLESPVDGNFEESSARSGLQLVRAHSRSHDGTGLLQSVLAAKIERDLGAGDQPTVTRERHRTALRQACHHVGQALRALGGAPDQAAEDVRSAAAALASVIGIVDREAVLDEVFSSFCIGK